MDPPPPAGGARILEAYEKEMAMMTVRINVNGGHLVEADDFRNVWLTDDSGERVEVDAGRYITTSPSKSGGTVFNIPVEGGDGTYTTPAGAEEALLVASLAKMVIETDSMRFKAERYYGYIGSAATDRPKI